MTTLHIINRTKLKPFTRAGDAVILIENGGYTISEYITSEYLSSEDCVPVFAVEADVLARGITADEKIELVDYVGFVQLCTLYDKVVTW
ncbi:MAG: sulfur relay protein TusB/DsrH [Candidatus Azotimanducaceae bacterium]